MQRMGFVGYGFLEMSVEKEKSILSSSSSFFLFFFFFYIDGKRLFELVTRFMRRSSLF